MPVIFVLWLDDYMFMPVLNNNNSTTDEECFFPAKTGIISKISMAESLSCIALGPPSSPTAVVYKHDCEISHRIKRLGGRIKKNGREIVDRVLLVGRITVSRPIMLAIKHKNGATIPSSVNETVSKCELR